MNKIWEELFYKELVSPEERLSDVDTGEEIIIDSLVTTCIEIS